MQPTQSTETTRRRGRDTKPRKRRVASIPGQPRNETISAKVSLLVKSWYRRQDSDVIERWARGLIDTEK